MEPRLKRLSEQVLNVRFDIMRQILRVEADNWHTAAVDQELLEVPANVVRLQAVVHQTIFRFEIHGRRWTVSLQVQWKYMITRSSAIAGRPCDAKACQG